MTLTTRDWLALHFLPGLGPLRLAPLVRRWREEGEPSWPHGWLAALPANLAKPLRLWLDHPAKSPLNAPIEAALAWEAAADNHHLLHVGHPAWPPLLDHLPDPPPVLWARGELAPLSRAAMAMVGTRRPTREGRDNAASFSRQLVERGFCVVSGLALGIDGVVHQAALTAGGATVAVLGCGVDVVYPPSHASLYRALLEGGGLLLSEHPPQTRAHARFFPRRNRLITGLSEGVLVVEAAEKSGSLVSARLALEQGREVFALPGSIHNPQMAGCLHLIRQGEAALVRHVEDMLAELTHWQSSAPDVNDANDAAIRADTEIAPPAETADTLVQGHEPESPLLAALSDDPTPVDTLVELTGESVASLQLMLLELELEGLAGHAAGGWVRRGR
ncbi:DNA-processing protein DprA [Salinicola rhizosphaerae]|uniref:DNA processing protein DprA n=1 Tax=Salinicola rhizosphaerae TaxID=1443141 RepID=A0ABQ3E3T7_9GAMM|nr:DNA-processing protein DprA [Salinicola rhizosphaerae]GHB22513.1 DNA processing protein DprA [Salinicola rhizosphaerae]